MQQIDMTLRWTISDDAISCELRCGDDSYSGSLAIDRSKPFPLGRLGDFENNIMRRIHGHLPPMVPVVTTPLAYAEAMSRGESVEYRPTARMTT
jgi:hypothetical protein